MVDIIAFDDVREASFAWQNHFVGQTLAHNFKIVSIFSFSSLRPCVPAMPAVLLRFQGSSPVDKYYPIVLPLLGGMRFLNSVVVNLVFEHKLLATLSLIFYVRGMNYKFGRIS